MLSGCLQSISPAPQHVVTGCRNAQHASVAARGSRTPAHAAARGMQQVSNVLKVQQGQSNGARLAEECTARAAAVATPTALPGQKQQHLQQHLPLTQLHGVELQGQPLQLQRQQQQHQQQQQHAQDAVLAWGNGLTEQQSTAEPHPATDCAQQHPMLPLQQQHQQQLHQSEDHNPQQQHHQQHNGSAQHTAERHSPEGAVVGVAAGTEALGGATQQPSLQQCNGHHAQHLQQPVQLQDMDGLLLAALPLQQQWSQQQGTQHEDQQQQHLEQHPVLQPKSPRSTQHAQQRPAAGQQQQQLLQSRHAQEPRQQHKLNKQPKQPRAGVVQAQQQAHPQWQLRLKQHKPRVPGDNLQLHEIRVANSTQPGKLASALRLWLRQHTTAQHTLRQQQGQQQQRQQQERGSTQQQHAAAGAVGSAAAVPDVLLCCTSKAALLSALQAVAEASQAAAGLQQPFQLLLQPQIDYQQAPLNSSCGSHTPSNAGSEVGSSTWVQYMLRLSWSALPSNKQHTQQQSGQQQQPSQPQQQQHVQQPVPDLQQQQPGVRSHHLLQCDQLASPGSTGTNPGKHKAKKRAAAAHASSSSAAAASTPTGTTTSSSCSSSAGVQVPDTLYHLQWHVLGLLRGSWPTGLCASTPAGVLAAVKALVHVRTKLADAGRDLYVSVQPQLPGSSRSSSGGGLSSSGSSSGVVLWVVAVPASTLHIAAAAGGVFGAAMMPLTEQHLKERRQHRQLLKQQQGPLQPAVHQQQLGTLAGSVGAHASDQQHGQQQVQQQQGRPQEQQQATQAAAEQKSSSVQHSSMQSPLLPPDLQRANGNSAAVMPGRAANGVGPVDLQQQAAVANGKHSSHAEQACSGVAPEQLQPLC